MLIFEQRHLVVCCGHLVALWKKWLELIIKTERFELAKVNCLDFIVNFHVILVIVMAKSYLEHFLESLDTLPTDLHRNFTLMRDLDERTQDLIRKINTESESYMENPHSLSAKDKSDRYKEIRGMFGKAKELSDDKVQLAMQTYEMIDKHIRRLDSELSKLEAELKEKILFNSSAPQVAGGDEGKKKGRANQKQKQKGSATTPKNVVKEESERAKKKQKLNSDPNIVAIQGGNTRVNSVFYC